MFSFIGRILDRVDPSLESYGDPFLWRGSESEMKYFSALKLASCNCQVSVRTVYSTENDTDCHIIYPPFLGSAPGHLGMLKESHTCRKQCNCACFSVYMVTLMCNGCKCCHLCNNS